MHHRQRLVIEIERTFMAKLEGGHGQSMVKMLTVLTSHNYF
jgi:hypothetical protein